MKRIMSLLIAAAFVCGLASCGVLHCKECDDEVYKDGYCKYHYMANTVIDEVNENTDGLAGDVVDSVLDDETQNTIDEIGKEVFDTVDSALGKLLS